MSESFACGDPGTLVSYLYDECEPEERDTIEAHVARCRSCASEIDRLGWTRRQLETWTPPVTELGFQMPAPALEPRLPWWRAPLPAWAQAAAALLIFGTGLSVGLARGPDDSGQVAASPSVDVQPTDSASRTDLTQVAQQLRTEMAQIRTSPPAAAPAVRSDEEIMRRVQALVEQSEERQRREFTLRTVELARDFEMQRRVDLATVRETVGQLQGVTSTEIRQQREAIDRINNFILVSQQGR